MKAAFVLYTINKQDATVTTLEVYADIYIAMKYSFEAYNAVKWEVVHDDRGFVFVGLDKYGDQMCIIREVQVFA